MFRERIRENPKNVPAAYAAIRDVTAGWRELKFQNGAFLIDNEAILQTGQRSYVAFAFAAIHLSVISFFAFVNHTDTKLASRTGLLRALTESVMFYSNWSGVGTAYSYFAPKVAEIPRTRFEIVHVSGDISEYIRPLNPDKETAP
jgi:hypothetical protein